MRTVLALFLAVVAACPAVAQGVRVKDIAQVAGVRENQLLGYGIVVGLAGTGDRAGTQFTVQTLANMLERMGITVDPDDVKLRNVASVVVTAELPAFAKEGTRIDATVSSLGDASSLQGGTLLQTPLYAADGQIYAAAQGPVSIGGFTVDTGVESERVQKNHATVGRVPSGAIVEREISGAIEGDAVCITLLEPDFTTASRLAESVKAVFGKFSARAVDSSTVAVVVPDEAKADMVGFVAQLEHLRLEPDSVARVVINERTGTVVVGQGVQVSPVAVSHGNLIVEIRYWLEPSQPSPFAEVGETVVVPRTETTVREETGAMAQLAGASNIEELVSALNGLAVTPRDMIAIFQAIKEAGALHGTLEII